MKTLGIIGLCAVTIGAFACTRASETGAVASSQGASTTTTADLVVCHAGETQMAVVKPGIVTLTKAGALYKIASGQATALTLSADGKTGTWNHGFGTAATSTPVTCSTASAMDAPGWIAAGQLATYADGITSIAESIFEEEAEGDDDGAAKASTDSAAGYAVFAIETTNAASLDLGATVANSGGSLPGADKNSDTLSDDDNSYGGLSAAYGLGSGDDWGEYFQGASDGVSLGDSLGDSKATFTAHEKTKAFDGLVQTPGVSAVEVTVGQWTFFAPSDFSK